MRERIWIGRKTWIRISCEISRAISASTPFSALDSELPPRLSEPRPPPSYTTSSQHQPLPRPLPRALFQALPPPPVAFSPRTYRRKCLLSLGKPNPPMRAPHPRLTSSPTSQTVHEPPNPSYSKRVSRAENATARLSARDECSRRPSSYRRDPHPPTAAYRPREPPS